MRYWLWVLLLLGPAAAQEQKPGEPVAEAKPAATAPPADRDAFTFLRYHLNVTLDPARSGFAARGMITVQNDSAEPQARLALQISSSLKWAAIRSADSPLRFTSERVTHDIDHTGAVNEAIVELPSPVPPGQTVELEVGYSGTISSDATRLTRLGMPAAVAARSDWDTIGDSITAVRGVGHVAWYPVALAPATLDDGNRVFRTLGAWRVRHAGARFRVTFADIPGKVLISSGERKSEVELVYALERMGLEGPFFVVGDFATLTTANGRVHYRPGREEAARKVGALLAQAEPIAASGKAQRAVVVELPPGWLSHENGPTLLTPLTGLPDEVYQQQFAHLVTHASFYSPRPWIHEGLAHMAQAAALEPQKGRRAALDLLARHVTPIALVAPQEPGPDDARHSLINAADEIYYRSKAMWVWWMLREMLTEPVLKKALAAYSAEADRDPAMIQKLLEASTAKDLQWFFDDWVYRDRGLPDFRIVNVHPRETLRGTYIVTVTVENLGRAGAEVPIRIRMKDGEATGRLVVKGKSQASVRIEAAQYPVEVIVNDASVLEFESENNSFAVPEKPLTQ